MRTKIGKTARLGKEHQWSNGYDVSLTHWRSPVQSWLGIFGWQIGSRLCMNVIGGSVNNQVAGLEMCALAESGAMHFVFCLDAWIFFEIINIIPKAPRTMTDESTGGRCCGDAALPVVIRRPGHMIPNWIRRAPVALHLLSLPCASFVTWHWHARVQEFCAVLVDTAASMTNKMISCCV